MAKIRYSEYFYSIQGEGKWVGTPSVFLRTFGCNLECHGFGQPRGKLMPVEDMPFMQVNVDDYDSVEELPVAHIGCDSSASWSAKYKKLSPFITTDKLAIELIDILPQGVTFFDAHLIFTGGEPLLGWQKAYTELLEDMPDLTHITFETNGSKMPMPIMIDYFNEKRPDIEVTWMCSPKLSLTGEDQAITINPQCLLGMNKVKNSNINLKFVIRDEVDIVEVENACEEYYNHGVNYEAVFLMPEGATIEGQELTEKCVAELCMKHGYKFSPRLHINLFGNSWGT